MEAEAAILGHADGEPIRVLHIDDDRLLTELVRRQLAPYGIDVESLNDERHWKDAIQEGNHRIVLLDIDMPHRDGLQVLRDIKAHDGAIQVIMLTGVVRMFVILDALRDGAEFCFFKPIDSIEPIVRALQSTVRRINHWRDAVRHARRELEKLQMAEMA